MKKPSILIVDDSEIEQFLLKNMIEKYDTEIAIHQAYDGEEALSILEGLATPPTLILLDINMPGMNGHEFLDNYELQQNHCDTIVMLSSSEEASDIQRSLSHTCVKRYVSKPLVIEDLEFMVKTFCQT
ncbi:response regulator receiver protein [Paraglaciecola mesophila KMM 241]|uniref:Response regulator receiver protein n=1 Tax=Paraglaciecola mesophila KMM 241 TaxID=1128912 RepID=K6XPW6_9ALTE|nr:response regulator [Paraglaciecola mesophila]GAC22694.1 response regulator receiver protein [Paraglaciecola mesophila KMM 241]|tara:strand:- start:790 stop:1173 length:384 start_codon:yes stop_codon:yes gene_type:complete